MINIILDPLTIYFCSFILLGAVVFAFTLWLNTRKLITQLQAANTELKQYKPINAFDDNGDLIEQPWSSSPLTIAYQNREKMHSKISTIECLKSSWEAYQRSMQLPGVNFELKPSQAPALRNTMQVSNVFNMENIVEPLINLRFFTSIPNMLTGLGLLFTFVGLVIGIGNASLGLSSADIDSAKQSLNPLLTGASIAFTTSIVGIICSMVFSMFEKSRFFKLEKEVKKFSDYLASHIEFIDSDKLAAMQLEAIETQTKALANFQFDQQRITDETIKRVSKEFRDTLLDKAGSEIKDLAELISEMNKSMSVNLSSFTENQIKVGKATEQLTKAMQISMLNVTKQFSDSADEMGAREEVRINRIISTFETAGNNVSRVISSSTAEIEENLFVQSRVTIDNMSQASELYRQTMNSSVELLANIPERITNATEQSIKQSAMQLQGLMEQLLPDIVAKVSDSLGQQVDSFMSQISDAESHLAVMLEEFPSVVEQLGKLNKELVGNAQVIGKLHDVTKKSLTTFNKTSDSLTESVSNMTEANHSSAEVAKTYQELLKGIQDAAKNASDFSQSSAQTAVKLKQALSEHSNLGDGIKSAIEASMNQLHSGLGEYASLTNKHMSALDHDASKVSGHLVEAIKEIDLLVKDIAKTNTRLSGAA
ncbi:MAG: gas vesicle protein [Oleiphilaceae bacterium]|jgi:gas vesicle protein